MLRPRARSSTNCPTHFPGCGRMLFASPTRKACWGFARGAYTRRASCNTVGSAFRRTVASAVLGGQNRSRSRSKTEAPTGVQGGSCAPPMIGVRFRYFVAGDGLGWLRTGRPDITGMAESFVLKFSSPPTGRYYGRDRHPRQSAGGCLNPVLTSSLGSTEEASRMGSQRRKRAILGLTLMHIIWYMYYTKCRNDRG